MTMHIKCTLAALQTASADAILIDQFEDSSALSDVGSEVDKILNGAIRELIQSNDFRGKRNEVIVIYTRGALPSARVIMVGLGKVASVTPDHVRQAAAMGARKARELGCKTIAAPILGCPVGNLSPDQAAQALVEGVLLGLYRWRANQTSPAERGDIDSVTIFEPDPARLAAAETGVRAGEAVAAGVCRARDLTNQAPNYLTPRGLAVAAEQMALETGVRCAVRDVEWIKAQNMTAFLAVAQGSANPPVFIELDYPGSGAAPIVLVGKGITFDAGGISIKPTEDMEDMSSDMGGAAAVIGAVEAIARMKLPVHVVGLIAACENLPSGTAYRPADVIRTRSGKTVEIITTDAEGRVTLADALDYAAEFKPQAVIDLATLTGAVVIALGDNVAAGYFANDEQLAQKIDAASRSTGEKLWRMPLYADYSEKIRSDYADIKNAAGRYSGLGSSAMFLMEFTSYPWAHWDIAGMVLDKVGAAPSSPFTHPAHIVRGATGFGVQALVSLARSWKDGTIPQSA